MRAGLLALALWLAVVVPAAAERPSAVILMYHRFGEPGLAATNITLEQFEAHLRELREGGYAVRPLPEIVDALIAGRPLPPRTVAITIDDAYASAYREAWPRLKAAGFPFTLFVATDAVDRGYAGMMTWDQIRELKAAGVTIGNHSAAHAHMAFADTATNGADIARASARFEAELGARPDLFAYPYGEYSAALEGLVRKMGFRAAFGQQSGVAFAGADVFALPRFALNEHYGTLERFRLVANALPLPVTDVTPSDPLLGPNPPPFGFSLLDDIAGIERLACYVRGARVRDIERLGARRIEVRLEKPLPPGRSRVNCTVPGPDRRWRWFGVQFLVPPPG